MSRVQLALRVAGEATRLDHLGVEVETADEVTAATGRLAAEGLATATEEDTACCYAVQDKVWVTGPGAEPWEVYVVKADSDVREKAASSVCCAPDAREAGTAVPVTQQGCC
jgi:hypothetical protein